MGFSVSSYALAWLAGVLSILSPCVLPIVPILLTTAANTHRRGVWLLACGLSLSFAGVGLFLATIGAAAGLEAAQLRDAGAILMIVFAIVLLSAPLQRRFAAVASGVSNGGMQLLERLHPEGLRGQFVVGLLLGVVWSPCVGPTLGAAASLAAQGQQLPQVVLMMALFGLGAGLPLVLLGSLSRAAIARTRQRLLQAGALGKNLLGAVFLAIGLSIVSGLDKSLEAFLVAHSPAWLVDLTTRF